MVEKDYIDITPRGVDNESVGQVGRKTTVFQETELEQIQRNLAGLTKEGILKKIELWKASSNAQVRIKYEMMLKQCKNIASSGKTKDGKIIYARNPKTDEPTWTS